MSDLLSPIYVVFDADEADAFWGLVGVMGMMVCLAFSVDSSQRLVCSRSPRCANGLYCRRATFCAIRAA